MSTHTILSKFAKGEAVICGGGLFPGASCWGPSGLPLPRPAPLAPPLLIPSASGPSMSASWKGGRLRFAGGVIGGRGAT